MRNWMIIWLGVLLIAWGLLVLVSNLLDIPFWTICWPTMLILIGVWMILAPRLTPPGALLKFVGDIRREGEWQVQEEEIWNFVGDLHLDFRQANIPSGETLLRLTGFVGDVELRIPKEVGLAISSSAFVSDTSVYGSKDDTIGIPFSYQSAGYAEAERKLRVELKHFVVDLDVEA
jgi:hypothetical protein